MSRGVPFHSAEARRLAERGPVWREPPEGPDQDDPPALRERPSFEEQIDALSRAALTPWPPPNDDDVPF